MRRLCTEGACSYSGRSVQRVAVGVELRPRLKSLDVPSNPKVTVIATGAGLSATAKGVEHSPDPIVHFIRLVFRFGIGAVVTARRERQEYEAVEQAL